MRLTALDIKGVYTLLPTPCKPGGDQPEARDTVDVDALAWFIENVISSGTHGILLLGTMGEIHTLLPEEWELTVRTAAEVVNRRVPLFCGTTTLNTRESIQRTKLVVAAGADGVMNGVPMWLPPSVDNAVQYYADLAQAVPEAAIFVYHNPAAFRVKLSPPAWKRLAQIPQVVAVKTTVTDLSNLLGLIRAVDDAVSVMVADRMMYPAMMFGARGGWSSRASISPHPVLRLYEACARGEWAEADQISVEVGRDWPPCSIEEFHTFDTPLVKTIINAATGGRAGPVRRPFVHMPDHLEQQGTRHGQQFLQLAEKYAALAPEEGAESLSEV